MITQPLVDDLSPSAKDKAEGEADHPAPVNRCGSGGEESHLGAAGDPAEGKPER